jgi:TPP-dependent pyruvate/acetoin dehydrogenase alpha subunit
MNFAAVFSTPTVFLCQNNGWAISMSRADQTRSETIAVKAVAYGMPGVLVDGNDALAMLAVTTEAVERARSGGGPTLIEALTYRVGPHTTADDAGRYRPEEEVEAWRTRDPIDRLRAYLQQTGEWSEAWESDLEVDASAEIEAAVAAAEDLAAFDPDGHLGRAFAEPTRPLADQRRFVPGDDHG